MRPQALYRVDQKIGGAICWLASFLASRCKRMPEPSEWQRIAVAKYMGMGSLVLATPLLQILRQGAPQAEIAIVTSLDLARLARMLPVDKVFAWDFRSVSSALKTFLPFISSLRRWRPDVFFDLEFFVNTSALIAWLSGAPIRVGFHHAQSPRGQLLTHYLPFTPRHTAELFAGLAWAVGISVKSLPSLCRLSYDPQKVRNEVRSLPRPFVVVNPNAGELALQRRWMPERFRELLYRLSDSFPNMHFVLIGSRSERKYVAGVLAELANHPRIRNLAGQLNLDELCFVLDNAVALITNDSGPMHLAAALGTPCVALFGPETPDHYGPMGEGHRTIYKRLPCSPCLTPFDGKMFPCPFEIRCLREISVDEVFEAAKKVINRR